MGDDTAPTFGVIRELRRKMNDGTEKKYRDYVHVITMISGSTYEFETEIISAADSPKEYAAYSVCGENPTEIGKKFLGELKDGLPNGQGKEIYKRVESEDDGAWGTTFYNEEMMRDEPLMPGMQRSGRKKIRGIPLTNKYEGEFKDGEYHGQGTLTYQRIDEEKTGFTDKEWSKYEGEWKDGKEHGQGTFTSFWGDVYVGGFKDGKKHGQGTETTRGGTYTVGEWTDKGYWNGKTYRKKGGKLVRKCVNGKRKEGFLNLLFS